MSNENEVAIQSRRALFRSAGIAAAGFGLATLNAPLLAAPRKIARRGDTVSSDVGVMQGGSN